MAIERLSFPHHLNIQAGVELQDSSPAHLMRMVHHFGKRGIKRLVEGEYDLTPPIWQRNTYKHTLTVLDSGIGVVRLIPRFTDSHSGILDHEGVYDYKNGGRILQIPEDQPIAVVVGPNRLNHNICLYELVYFVPGPNPR